jgi:DNA-binding NarL/FixJ family response regulator
MAGTAADGVEALERAETLRPDVVLMDLKMPRLNGIQATARLARLHPEIKVVVLTTYDADDWEFDATRAEAGDYLLKDSEAAEISAAVRGAAGGEVRLDPAVAGKVLAEFSRLVGFGSGVEAGSPRPGADDALQALEPLTDRELAILEELAQGKSNREIADSLYLADGTVKN